MALARIKTWIAGEILTASDLNAEYNNILTNARSLISPLTGVLDMDGFELILDADGDSSITADTNDQIDIRIGGSDRWRWSASGHLLAVTDNTYDIGASGATRPRDVYVARNVVIAGTATVNGNATLGDAAGDSHTVNGAVSLASGDLTLSRAAAGSPVLLTENNTSNTAGSDAALALQVGGASAGDPFISLGGPSVTAWAIGIDNSDSDIFKVSKSTALGTNDYLKIDTSGNVGLETVNGNVVATQAQQETGTATNLIVTPGRQHFHPATAKAWCSFLYVTGTPTTDQSYNVSSISDSSAGTSVVNFTTSFSAATFCPVLNGGSADAGAILITRITARTTGSVTLVTATTAAVATDPLLVTTVACFGDL